MRLIPDSNNIARIIEIPGVKKTTEYLFIGTGFALVALGFCLLSYNGRLNPTVG